VRRKVPGEAFTNWRTGLVGLALVALATDCSLHLSVRQGFEERPSPDCLADALATAPDVTEVTSRDEERFAVILRDSTFENGRRPAAVWGSPPGSPYEIAIHFVWDGPRRQAPPAEERTVTTLGRRLLAHLRSACALNGPRRVECVYNSGRRAESCEAVHLTPS
jgi:hypothetical protein